MEIGWQKLLAGYPWFAGEGNYPIAAYSEFMPPPRVGRKPYGSIDHGLYREDDPFGWHVSEYEEALELQPGLEMIAKELMHVVHHLGCRRSGPWHRPQEARRQSLLARRLGRLPGAAGRSATCSCSRWRSRRPRTTKAASAGPCSAAANRARPRPFGGVSIRAPRREVPREWSEGFIRRLLAAAYDEKPEALADLRKAGFRVYTNPAAALACLRGKKSRCPSGPRPIAGKRARSAASATC